MGSEGKEERTEPWREEGCSGICDRPPVPPHGTGSPHLEQGKWFRMPRPSLVWESPGDRDTRVLLLTFYFTFRQSLPIGWPVISKRVNLSARVDTVNAWPRTHPPTPPRSFTQQDTGHTPSRQISSCPSQTHEAVGSSKHTVSCIQANGLGIRIRPNGLWLRVLYFSRRTLDGDRDLNFRQLRWQTSGIPHPRVIHETPMVSLMGGRENQDKKRTRRAIRRSAQRPTRSRRHKGASSSRLIEYVRASRCAIHRLG